MQQSHSIPQMKAAAFVALPRNWRGVALESTVVGVALALAIAWLVSPMFGEFVRDTQGPDPVMHIGLVADALDTLKATRALPISSAVIAPGVEYPFWLFLNPAFYVGSALVSYVVRVPAHVGMGLVIGAAFAVGVGGMLALARRAGLHPYLAIPMAFLYALGPYPSLNLYVRVAFAEYMMWQLVPLLLLLVQLGSRDRYAPWNVLGAAIALAAPCYIHKPTAAHVILLLLALGVNQGVPNGRSIGRLALAVLIAALISAPAWYPPIRGLDAGSVSTLTMQGRPIQVIPSVVNFLWPTALDSLGPVDAGGRVFQGRFALQLGLVPCLGVLLAAWTIATQPGLAVRRRLIAPLLLFGLNVVLILDYFDLWPWLPSPLRYLQFSYRLIGAAHFLGFVLLAQSLGSAQLNLRRHSSPLLRRLLAVELIGLAGLSVLTYWQLPPLTERPSAEIDARSAFDQGNHFYPRSVHSSLRTHDAIHTDGRLAVPPVPVAAPPKSEIILAGSVLPPLFANQHEAVAIRIFGLQSDGSETQPGGAALLELTRVLSHLHGSAPSQPGAPLSKLLSDVRPPTSSQAGPNPGTEWTRLPNSRWRAGLLGEARVAAAQRFELRAALPASAMAIVIECSRNAVEQAAPPRVFQTRSICLDVEYLALPNEGSQFVRPQEIAAERRTRLAFGSQTIDARDLGPAHYLLPTFYYPFVRVTGSDGRSVPVYHFDRRAAIRHEGDVESYVVSYAMEPELLALLAGVLLFGAYALVLRLTTTHRLAATTPLTRWPRT